MPILVAVESFRREAVAAIEVNKAMVLSAKPDPILHVCEL